MIGRSKEKDILRRCMESDSPEFLVVYGRRRVGKTYLIKEFFNEHFAFYATGLDGGKTREQLKAFNTALREYGCSEKKIPEDWFEAFLRLKELLKASTSHRDSISKKKIVFLDELPWMSTARSDFKRALDYFWNSWGSTQNDLLLIVCGSATSWIIDNILDDKGGFYNRITRQIHLMPFSLGECEAFLKERGHILTRSQIMETYMYFGGIPYYLRLLDERLTPAQNVYELVIKESGSLHYEYDRLFGSLFKHSDRHLAIIEALKAKRGGIKRVELAANKKIGDGEPLTKALNELLQCGFIRKYSDFTKEKQGFFYQITDPFVLFMQNIRRGVISGSWTSYINTPGYYAWRGNAFETLCLNHIDKIKSELGISGVESNEFAWRSREKKKGVQIDLIIDRRDDVIDICEMKFTNDEFEVDGKYEEELYHKIEVFQKETNNRKAVHLILVSANGLKRNSHSAVFLNQLDKEALFK